MTDTDNLNGKETVGILLPMKLPLQAVELSILLCIFGKITILSD